MKVVLSSFPKNVFNATQISASCIFHGPIISTKVQPFYFQNFTRTASRNGSEVLTPSGEKHWRVRFMPQEVGKHSFTCIGAKPTDGQFVVTHSNLPGVVTVGRNSQYFERDGAPFWLVGENVGWSGIWPYFNGSEKWSNGTGKTYFYDRVLTRIAEVGGNYIRMWIGPGLVENPVNTHWGNGSFSAMCLDCFHPEEFGTYNLEAAWRIDYVLRRASELNITVLLTLDSQQGVCNPKTQPWCWWEQATLNVDNGGPLRNASLVWTDEKTISEWMNRWKYAINRFASFSSVFSWQIFNEVNNFAGWEEHLTDGIHTISKLLDYLSVIDPYRHLNHNSFGGTCDIDKVPGCREVFHLPKCDFASIHQYGREDYGKYALQNIVPIWNEYRKPTFIGEMGASAGGPFQHILDPTGIALHNSAWASLVSLGAGSAMPWWWNEVDSLNLYSRLKGAAQFSTLVPWLDFFWQPLSISNPSSGWDAGGLHGKDSSNLHGESGLFSECFLFWARNSNYTWAGQNGCSRKTSPPASGSPEFVCDTRLKRKLDVISGIKLTFPDVTPGLEISWYNTTTGMIVQEEMSS